VLELEAVELLELPPAPPIPDEEDVAVELDEATEMEEPLAETAPPVLEDAAVATVELELLLAAPPVGCRPAVRVGGEEQEARRRQASKADRCTRPS